MNILNSKTAFLNFIEKNISFILSLSVLLLSLKSLQYISSIGSLIIPIQILFVLSSIFYLKKKEYRYTFYLIIPYLFWIILSSIWSIYQSYTLIRASYYFIMAISAFTAGYIYKEKYKNLNFLIPTNIFLLVLSIISLLFSFPENRFSGGNAMGFMGFVVHQNTLAGLLFFTMLPYFINFNNKKKLMYFSSIILNMGLIILTYSRGTLISLALLLILLSFIIFPVKRMILIYSAVLVLFSSIYILSEPINEKVNNLLNKGGNRFMDRRTEYFEVSYSAAMNGGLIGQGFGVSDISLIRPYMGFKENGMFRREKMVSFFGLIEETGIIGFILFLLPIIYFYKLNLKSRNNVVIIIMMVLLFYAQIESVLLGVNILFINVYYYLLSVKPKVVDYA